MKPFLQVSRIISGLILSTLLVMIITVLFMSYAKGEYVIHISVINETDEFQNIIVFQQDDELGLMFTKVFPLPWQVFPLPGRAEGVERKGTADFPLSQHIGVTRDIEDSPVLLGRLISLARRYGVCAGPETGMQSNGSTMETVLGAPRRKVAWNTAGAHPASSPADRTSLHHLVRLASAAMGKLIIKAAANNGDRFEYSLDEKGGQHIVKLGDRNKNGSISCRNNSEGLVNIDFYKSDARIAIWPSLSNGDEARFLLKRKICFSYDNDVKSGDPIRTRVEGDRVVSVELAGYSTIEARLVYDPGSPGKRKKWIITKS